MTSSPARIACLLLVFAAPVLVAAPQETKTAPAKKQEQAPRWGRVDGVQETLEYLASDRLQGRGTPSKGLEMAADYIAERFRKAGLEPGGADGSWFHHYELDGYEFDSLGMSMSVKTKEGKRQLEPGRDVRLFRPARKAYENQGDVFFRLDGKTSGTRAISSARRSRRVIVIVVDEASAIWSASVGKRQILKRGLGRHPVVVVREGILDEGRIEGELGVAEAKEVKVKLRNVVGVAPGKKREQRIVISAHYDHLGVGIPVEGDGIYNGADDDATGTAAVIQLADALGKTQKERDASLVFVCFSAEEKGLLGSKAFAERPPFKLSTVKVNLNLEMLGRPMKPENRMKVWLTGREYSNLEELAKPALERAGVGVRIHELQAQLFRASDNYSLVKKGVLAQSFSGGGLHRQYHQPTDETGLMDYEHLAAVIRGLREVVVELSPAKVKPAWTKKGKKAIAGSRRR